MGLSNTITQQRTDQTCGRDATGVVGHGCRLEAIAVALRDASCCSLVNVEREWCGTMNTESAAIHVDLGRGCVAIDPSKNRTADIDLGTTQVETAVHHTVGNAQALAVQLPRP